MPPTTYLEAIRSALEEMERDPLSSCWARTSANTGRVQVTMLPEALRLCRCRHPDRRVGDRRRRRRRRHAGPGTVVEIQFIDFIAVAFNQLVNFVARTTGAGRAAADGDRGPPAPACARAIIRRAWRRTSRTCPGSVVQPATAYDAKGALKGRSAIQPGHLPGTQGALPAGEGRTAGRDWTVPIGTAAVRRPGRDLTLVSYGAMLHKCSTRRPNSPRTESWLR